MAHWIIKDYVYHNTKLFTCSHCRTTFDHMTNSYLAYLTRCPACEEYIDKNFEHYEWMC